MRRATRSVRREARPVESGSRPLRPGALLLVGILLGLAGATGAGAQEPMRQGSPDADSVLVNPRAAALDAQAAEIAAQLRCPVCSGQSVLESNAAISQEMQEVIRERLERGDGEEEILAYFRGAYGDWIILRPPATGWPLLVYVLPAVALIGGALWVFALIRRWRDGARISRPAGTAGGGSRSPGTDAADQSLQSPGAAASGPPGELSADDEAWLRRSIGGG